MTSGGLPSRSASTGPCFRQRRHWVVIRSLRPDASVDRFLHPDGDRLGRRLDDMDFTWSDSRRSTIVAVERPAEGVQPTSWAESAGAVAVARGQIRWYGDAWRDPSEWPAEVLGRWPSRPYGYPLEGTVGDATVVCVDPEGRGVITADHFGSASAYFHMGPDLLVAASRPALVAEVLELIGRPVRPDLVGLAWLARAGYQVGRATSFEGVSRLPIGACIHLTGQSGATLVEQAHPWSDGSDLGSLTAEDVCDVVAEAVADQLRAAAGLGHRIVLDVTGGRDSRLVLAVALSVLDPGSFLLRTVGPPSAPDVQVSAQIAAVLGLEHQSGFPRPRPPGTFPEHAEDFLGFSDGCLTIWVASVPHPYEPEVRVSGISGEMYRVGSYEVPLIDAGPAGWSPSPQQAAAAIDASYTRGLTDDVLRPAFADRLSRYLHDYFVHLEEIGTPRDQLVYRYFAGYHNRVATGELLELESDHRVLPLVDLRGVRALACLPQTARYEEVVHRGLIRRFAPRLLDLPLASGAWRVEQRPAPPPQATSRPPGSAVPARPASSKPSARPAGGAPAPAWPVLALAKAAPDKERRDYMTEILSDAPAATWEMFDRRVVADLLDRFDDMPMRSRKQIYAAATAAGWLRRRSG